MNFMISNRDQVGRRSLLKWAHFSKPSQVEFYIPFLTQGLGILDLCSGQERGPQGRSLHLRSVLKLSGPLLSSPSVSPALLSVASSLQVIRVRSLST